jgi:FtsP/CotA-like multicopper oxidase with cupredoxin domain
MSQRTRVALVAAFLVGAVVAFVIAKPGGGDEQASPGQTARGGTKTKAAPPKARFEQVTVQGAARTFRVHKGETVRIAVRSKTPDEVHLHGYDIEKRVEPGRPARFVFDAKFEGVFEMEAHKSGNKRVASLVVQP